MLIYEIAQMIIIDLVALGCIPWLSTAFQGIQLYYKALGSIPRDSTSTRIDWAWRAIWVGNSARQVEGNDCIVHKNLEWNKGRKRLVLCILIIKTTFTYEIEHLGSIN
jgi:TPP-dependent trihydroxycyclohexane-1,2-dione (THcHDO) dehydratase